MQENVALDGFVGCGGEVVEGGIEGWDVAGQVGVGQVDQVNQTDGLAFGVAVVDDDRDDQGQCDEHLEQLQKEGLIDGK